MEDDDILQYKILPAHSPQEAFLSFESIPSCNFATSLYESEDFFFIISYFRKEKCYIASPPLFFFLKC